MAERNSAFVFRLNDHGQGPDLIRQIFLEKGWVEFDEDTQPEHDWNLWWRTSRFRNSDYDQLMPWQRLNHYPRSTAITKKDSLARNLKRMRGVYGPNVYNFSPIAFNLPNDYTKFVGEYSKLKELEKDKSQYWICKPADLSRGRGIFIFKDLSELQYDCNAVVQRYISNPFLISGYKCDLRLYVAVSSFHPLNIYIYQEGLVRFSTEKFDLSHLGNMFSHLTNTSINKYSPSYTADKERVGPGCKWTLSQLRHFFHQANIDDQPLWAKIINIIILTLLIQAHQVPQASNCFELYGFDIMIDENFKPWLLEVNFSPALSCDCQADAVVKKPMLHDIIDMLWFSEKDKERGGDDFASLKKKHLPWNDFSHRGLSRQHSGQGSSIGHLPNIPWNNVPSLMSANKSRYDGEEEEGGSDDVERIIPGCGLPSVQNPITSGRSSASSNHSSETARRNRTPGKKIEMKHKINLQKKLSKISAQSDSGISSFSGSSDNSDPGSCVDEVAQSRASGAGLLCSADGAKATSTRANHPNSTVQDAGTHDGVMHSSSLVRHSIPGAIRSQKTEQRQKFNHLSFTANPLSGKSALLGRRGSSNTYQKRSYAKPWRKTKPEEVGYDGGRNNNSKKNPVNNVGDFYLVFPFSEVTRNCAMQNLDTKVVIKECQKLLKQKLEQATSTLASNESSRNADSKRVQKTASPVEDITLPWSQPVSTL